ncbi:MAG TPA: hypothetical protein VGM92_08780 [Candidatus Kapabacteria bacterium]|jgi:hypothetical protein
MPNNDNDSQSNQNDSASSQNGSQNSANLQGGSQNSADLKSKPDQNKPDTPTDDDIQAIRHDAKYAERRNIIRLMREGGHDVNNKTLDSYLESLKPTASVEPKKSKGKTDDEPNAEAELLRKQLVDVEKERDNYKAANRGPVIEAAIVRATAGIAFANEEAAEDAIAAFQRYYQFELDDAGTVQVIDSKGEPLMDKYKAMTLREAFNQFLDKRPHFKKGDKRDGQDLKHQRGAVAQTGTVDDFIRKAAGINM